MKAFWEDRYSQEKYVYGEEPNEFFKTSLSKLKPGKMLLPAEGEGRNAVFAAKLGWDVSAFDLSDNGKLKAEALAKKNNVSIHYTVGECGTMSYPVNSFDAIAFIFAHFPAEEKSTYYRQLMTFLKPGGFIILESFSMNHVENQLANPAAGGPRDPGMLASFEEIARDFPDFDTLLLTEEDIELNEGQYHSGKASVIRFLGKKR